MLINHVTMGGKYLPPTSPIAGTYSADTAKAVPLFQVVRLSM